MFLVSELLVATEG